MRRPVSSFAPERSFFVMSASKVISAGLRAGFISAPPTWRRRLVDAIRAMMLAGPSLIVELLSQWLEDGTADEVIGRRRQEFERRVQMAGEILEGHEMQMPPHSCFAWLTLPEIWSTTEFALEAHRRGVGVAPAEIFSVSKGRSANALRVALGCVDDRETLRTGLTIIADVMKSSPSQATTTV